MNKLATLTLLTSLLGATTFAAPTYIISCHQPDLDHGYEAIFLKNSRAPGKMSVKLSTQSLIGPQQLAELPCMIVGQKQTPSGDLFTSWNCQDGNEAGYRVTLSSGGFTGFTRSEVFRHLRQIAQLACAPRAER